MATMTTYERALQAYQVLIAAAHNRQVLTYGIVGDLIGVPRQAVSSHLAHIMRYCEQHSLPPLTVLVVQKGSGMPGTGLSTTTDVNRDREQVFQHNWFGMKPLTVADLKVATEAAEDDEQRKRAAQ